MFLRYSTCYVHTYFLLNVFLELKSESCILFAPSVTVQELSLKGILSLVLNDAHTRSCSRWGNEGSEKKWLVFILDLVNRTSWNSLDHICMRVRWSVFIVDIWADLVLITGRSFRVYSLRAACARALLCIFLCGDVLVCSGGYLTGHGSFWLTRMKRGWRLREREKERKRIRN